MEGTGPDVHGLVALAAAEPEWLHCSAGLTPSEQYYREIFLFYNNYYCTMIIM